VKKMSSEQALPQDNHEMNHYNMAVRSIFGIFADRDRQKEQFRISEKYGDKKMSICREIQEKWELKWETHMRENQDYFERQEQRERELLGIDENLNLIKSLQDEYFSLHYMQSKLDQATILYNEECEKIKHRDNVMFCFIAVFVAVISMYINYLMDRIMQGEKDCNFPSFFSIDSIPSLAYHLLSKKVCTSMSYSKYSNVSNDLNPFDQNKGAYFHDYMPWNINVSIGNMYFIETIFCGMEIIKAVLLPLVVTSALKYLPFLKSKSDYVQIAMIFYFLVSDMVAALVRVLGLHFAVYLLLKLYPRTSWYGSVRNRNIMVYFLYPCMLVSFAMIIMVHSETGLGLLDAELYQRVYSICVHCFVETKY